MFAPLILSVLLPLNPAHFLRELVQWFIGVLARTLQDQGFRDWLKENPKDRQGLPDLLGSLLMIEDMISALIHIRARQTLGHRHRRKGKGRRLRYGPTGHPRSLEEIERRFQRALARLADVERLAARRAARIKRLLEQAAAQLEVIHHPVAPPPTTTSGCVSTTTIPVAATSTSTSICALARIRAPPASGRAQKINPAQPADPISEIAASCLKIESAAQPPPGSYSCTPARLAAL